MTTHDTKASHPRALRGVNLGGWLVLERWMTPSLFAGTEAIDEYTFMQTEGASDTLDHHRRTFITEDDWRWLAAHGIEVVRIPVGYWLVEPDGPYEAGLEYLDWAFEMAARYDIQVLVDLHGAPASQNGHDHSGRAGKAGWLASREARARTIAVLETLHARYESSSHYWGLQLLNEPSTRLVHRALRHFYAEAARVTRGRQYTVFHDGFTPRLLSGALGREPRAVMDVHLYHMTSWLARLVSAERFVGLAERWYSRLLRRVSRRQPVIVGEWSIVLRGESLRHLSEPDALALMQRFGEAQLTAYESGALAWFYWTYKTEAPGIWHFRSLVEDKKLRLPRG